MDYDVFIDCIRKTLEELPIARKDAWILEQAKMMLEKNRDCLWIYTK